MTLRWTGICLDCRDAEEMARFYGRLLGWEVSARDEPEDRLGGSGWISMRDPGGGAGLSFQAEDWYEPPVWPEEPGELSKMIHLEIYADDVGKAVEHVLRCGGSEAPHQPSDRDATSLRVMLDPAGHPFCLFSD